MKKTVFFFALLFFASAVMAQKDFEGVLVYRDNMIEK